MSLRKRQLLNKSFLLLETSYEFCLFLFISYSIVFLKILIYLDSHSQSHFFIDKKFLSQKNRERKES
jgi:hypothetical protein